MLQPHLPGGGGIGGGGIDDMGDVTGPTYVVTSGADFNSIDRSDGGAETPYYDPLYEFDAPKYFDFSRLDDESYYQSVDDWFETFPAVLGSLPRPKKPRRCSPFKAALAQAPPPSTIGESVVFDGWADVSTARGIGRCLGMALEMAAKRGREVSCLVTARKRTHKSSNWRAPAG
eukprot:jgi/Chlat1/3338/Chrsp23S03659